MRDFRQLTVWERSHQLVLATYKFTAAFPKHELYGLTSQMRRAAGSIPANIAEGCGRTANGDLHRFLAIAMGSASELRYFVILARDLQFLSDDGYGFAQAQVDEVQRMLSALIRKVEAARKLQA
jgi:four helix bundle protein